MENNSSITTYKVDQVYSNDRKTLIVSGKGELSTGMIVGVENLIVAGDILIKGEVSLTANNVVFMGKIKVESSLDIKVKNMANFAQLITSKDLTIKPEGDFFNFNDINSGGSVSIDAVGDIYCGDLTEEKEEKMLQGFNDSGFDLIQQLEDFNVSH